MDRKFINSDLILYLTFFAIAWGLGYSTLNRYDPSEFAGLSDILVYSKIVENGINLNDIEYDNSFRSTRIVFPSIARVIYLLTPQLGTWSQLTHAFLITSSIFTSLSAFLIYKLSFSIFQDYQVSIIASFLFLTNFVVINLHQVGLIDSAYCFSFILLLYILLHKKLFLLVPLFLIATLTKEQFVVFGSVILTTYYLLKLNTYKQIDYQAMVLIALSISLSVITLIIFQSYVRGEITYPWQIITDTEKLSVTVYNLELFTSRVSRFIMVIGPILFLAIPNLNKINRDILISFLIVIIIQLILGFVLGITGSGHARSLFNVSSFILCVSAAFTIKNLLLKK